MAARTRAKVVEINPVPDPEPAPVTPISKHAKVSAARAGLAHRIDQRMKTLTASAEVLDADGKVVSNTNHGATRTWQTAVLSYARQVPELSAASMYQGNACSMVQLELGRRHPDGSVDDAYREAGAEDGGRVLVEGIDPMIAADAEEIIASLRTGIGGQSELLRSYGEKAFLIGESFLIPVDSPAGRTFDVLSVFELRKDGGKWVRLNGPGDDSEPLAPGTEPIRVYRPDPQWSRLATSSVRACLPILEELVILTQMVRGSALSRMALSGVFAIADECDDPITDPDGPDGAEDTNPLLVDIINAGVKAIDDPASPSAFMPYVMQVPLEVMEKNGLQVLEFPQDDALSIEKREEAVARLARGLDCAYERVVGHQSTTFANAMQISLDEYRIHIQPMVVTFADAMAAAVLWPELAMRRGITAAEIQTKGYPPEILAVGILPNPFKLVAHPDRTKDIGEAYKTDTSQTLIANAEYRDALGLDPSGGPSQEETDRRVEQIQLVKERITVDAPTAEAPLPVVASAAPDQDLVGLVYRIAGAAEQTVERAIEKVGAKVWQRAKGLDKEAITGKENVDVARILGPATTSRLLDGDPIAAEVRAFTRNVRRWAVEAGHPHADVIAETFGAFLTGVIQKRLYETGPEVSPEMCRPLILGVGVS